MSRKLRGFPHKDTRPPDRRQKDSFSKPESPGLQNPPFVRTWNCSPQPQGGLCCWLSAEAPRKLGQMKSSSVMPGLLEVGVWNGSGPSHWNPVFCCRAEDESLAPRPVEGVASGLFHSEATSSLPRPLTILEWPAPLLSPSPPGETAAQRPLRCAARAQCLPPQAGRSPLLPAVPLSL